MNDFLPLVYQVFFTPKVAFEQFAQEEEHNPKHLLMALCIIPFVSVLGVFVSTGETSVALILVKLLLAVLVGYVSWVVATGCFALCAGAFGQAGHFMKLLVATSFATLPWIFLPVFNLFQLALGSFGQALYMAGAFVLWGWTVTLFCFALKTIYAMSLEKILMAVLLPFLMMAVAIAWITGFFTNLISFTLH